jgi:hypothetical protein
MHFRKNFIKQKLQANSKKGKSIRYICQFCFSFTFLSTVKQFKLISCKKNLVAYFYILSSSCGLYYKHVMIINYTSSGVNKLKASLNDHVRVIILWLLYVYSTGHRSVPCTSAGVLIMTWRLRSRNSSSSKNVWVGWGIGGPIIVVMQSLNLKMKWDCC